MGSKRRKLDFYQTSEILTQNLLKNVDVHGNVAEICSGHGAITRVLQAQSVITNVETNDLNFTYVADRYEDARSIGWPYEIRYDDYLDAEAKTQLVKPDWVITNPPFYCADEILKNLLFVQEIKQIALLLRLTFLEPTKGNDTKPGRSDLLTANPPVKIIVNERISFTDDGNTDSVTTAWMIWSALPLPGPAIIIAPNSRCV